MRAPMAASSRRRASSTMSPRRSRTAPGRSSAVADERTATRPPSARYASRTAVATSGGTAISISRARAAIGSVGSIFAALAAAAYASVVITKPSGTGKPARMSSPRFAPFPPATARSCAPNVDSGTTRGPLTRHLAPRSERTRRGPDSDLHQPVVPPVALAAPERAGLDLPADEDEEQGPNKRCSVATPSSSSFVASLAERGGMGLHSAAQGTAPPIFLAARLASQARPAGGHRGHRHRAA